jgi:alpha-L-rhamnosidase
VHYAGTPLESRSDYQWRVKVWDADNIECAWSNWSGFETGIIAPDQWSAHWIAGGGALRGSFEIEQQPIRARAYVSGLGYYEFFCNGKKVSAAALAPSYTDFDKRVEYEIIDLLPALQEGENRCGFLLADGWWRFSPPAQKRRLQVLAEIVLEYADGRREVLRTDETWQTNAGPFLPEAEASPHQLFDGVHLDLGWLQNGWDAGEWRSALTAGEGVGELVPALVQPIRPVASLPPQSVRCLADNLLGVDFGQNFTGWVRFRATAPAATLVTIRHAELLRDDGRLNPDTLRTAKQTDTFRLSGTPDTVEPRLLYHGLRYAEIEGPADAVETSSIEGRVIHTDLPVIGEVVTSDARINWLLDALRWTVRGNAMSVMTDVCQRDERRGWLMDGFNALKAGMLWYDMNAFGRKWFEDMAVNQQPEGCLYNDTAPSFACEGWGKMFGIGWQRTVVLLPMELYRKYGDRDLLERAFPVMCRWADYVCSQVKNNLLPDNLCKHGPEHLSVGRRNNDLANNALAVDALRQVAAARKILGCSGDNLYESTADQIADATHKRWFNPRNGCYGGGENFSQANQIYALRFGICPVTDRELAFARLVDDMMEGRGTGPVVLSGVGSLEHVPFVLSDFGRDDLVWQWLQREEYPGYGFMQKNGATAIWERWEKMDYNEMNAHNHAGLTGIGVWLMERLVGIQVEAGPEPVFHLRPGVHLPIDSLKARWQSRWGEVRVGWQTAGDRRELHVTIPPGCKGQIHEPGKSPAEPWGSGKHQTIVKLEMNNL